MATLPVNLYGDEILRRKAKHVESLDEKTRKFIDDMFETMRASEGVGLSANQVGSRDAIFVIDVSPLEGYEDEKPTVFINPRIVERSDETDYYEEGCLSLPGLRAEVERPTRITIEYLDEEFQPRKLTRDDFVARVVQHEYDHLRGVFFTDLLEDESRRRLKKSLNAIKRRKVDVHYEVTEPA
jgi:peptide deformylase